MPEVTQADIDQLSNGAVGLSVPHRRIHLGETWFASFKTPDASPLADDGMIDILVVVAAKRSAHMSFDISGGGDTEMQCFEDVVTSDLGNQLGTPNMNRESGASPNTKIYEGPTITAEGASMANTFQPGGTNPRTPGSVIRQNTEWIFKRGGVYLIRLTNRAGSSQPAGISCQWYEEERIVA